MRSTLSCIVFGSFLFAPPQTVAQSLAQFESLLVEYRTMCGDVLANPMDSHSSPATRFPVSGSEELISTDDGSYVDYFTETMMDDFASLRS